MINQGEKLNIRALDSYTYDLIVANNIISWQRGSLSLNNCPIRIFVLDLDKSHWHCVDVWSHLAKAREVMNG